MDCPDSPYQVFIGHCHITIFNSPNCFDSFGIENFGIPWKPEAEHNFQNQELNEGWFSYV